MTEVDLKAYKNAFENIGIPALITDENYSIVDINQAGLEFIGYEYDEIVGQHVGTITGNETVLDDLVELVSTGESWEGDYEVITNQGNTVYGRGSATPIKMDGKIIGFEAIFIDTTKERRFRHAAEVLNRVLRHDLRNQLNVAYGNVQLAKSATEVDTVSDHLETVIEELTSLINKSERARDLRELLEGTIDQPNDPIRLDVVLNEVIVEMVTRYERANFKFDNFPDVHVLGDHLLKTVLILLIDNAIVHNDKEDPQVMIDVEQGDGTVIVSVADNGPGIPEQQREMIFGREEIDDLHHGTGVSLYFVDNVLKSYSGEIWVEDNEPVGSVFKIELQKTG